jgi:TPR repeat protein
MQFLLGRAYLEGKGTGKDEKLGLDWIKRAARNGSGDAKSYLEKIEPPKSSP